MNIEKIDHIYRNGRHYDCLFGEPPMSFWLDVVGKVGATVHRVGMRDGQDHGRGRVTIFTKSIYEADTQIRRNTTFQRVDGALDLVGHLSMRMFFPQELEALLRNSGFEVIEKYGSYDRQAFSKFSSKQLIVAKRML